MSLSIVLRMTVAIELLTIISLKKEGFSSSLGTESSIMGMLITTNSGNIGSYHCEAYWISRGIL